MIEIISGALVESFSNTSHLHKVIVTSKHPCPVQTHLGVKIVREDMETSYDEADYINPQQVQAAILEGCDSISVISADTDVFLLLCDNYLSREWCAKVYMRNFSEEANVICIQSTVKNMKSSFRLY